MMGFKIAITGIVVFVFCSFMAHVARSEPKQPVMFAFFGWLILGGLASIPVGLIIQIWQ